MNDLISVIVPVYNLGDLAINCFKSILNQSITNYEVIVVDDGSIEKYSKIIKDFCINNNFNYYKKKNGGLSSARNFGIKKSKGNYICFIDSDDYVDKNYLEKLYKRIKKTKSDIVTCGFNKVYKYNTKKFKCSCLYEDLIHPNVWNRIYKRSIFDNYSFLEGKVFEDLALIPYLTLNYKCSYIDDYLYFYVYRKGSIITTINYKQYDILDSINNLEILFNGKHSNEYVFMYVYHILIGMVYRTRKMLTKNDLISIYNEANDKYNNWYSNKYIKNLPLFYRIYLYCIKNKYYTLIYFLLKIF